MTKVATGLATAPIATPELAAEAVKSAIKKADITSPSSVLLFLTSEFAADPQLAIKAAAKAAQCTQIVGCSATGIFTEEDWVLDSPAAAAMVFEGVSLNAIDNPTTGLALTLAAPNAIDSRWLNTPSLKFGGISGDATGHGPFSVWQNGKGITQGFCEMSIKNANIKVAASHGIKIISGAKKISKTNGYEMLTIDDQHAFDHLSHTWQQYNQSDKEPPFHRLLAIHAQSADNLARGEYNICSIVSCDEKNHTVTLTAELTKDHWISWAIRDTDAAQTDIVRKASELNAQLANKPAFALLFSCLGRGPYFYESGDQDLALIKALLPDLPIIGFYGNGEIAPILGKNEILQYSAVLALCSTKA